jgi:hypothetical protein
MTEKVNNIEINVRVEKVSGCKLRCRVVAKGSTGLQTGESEEGNADKRDAEWRCRVVAKGSTGLQTGEPRREMQIKEAQT